GAIGQQDAATREISENAQLAAQGNETLVANISSLSDAIGETNKTATSVLSASRALTRGGPVRPAENSGSARACAAATDSIFKELDRHCDRDRGEPHGSSPPTPPYVRVRIRRFDELNSIWYRDS